MSFLRDHIRARDAAVAPDQPLQAALDAMVRAGLRHVFLVEDGVPVGVLTERDVMRLYGEGTASGTLVGEVGRRPVIQADESRPVRFALGLMVDHGIRRVAVVDADGQWVGGVSHEDLLFAYEAELEPTALTVRELATARNLALSMPPDATLDDALAAMREHDRGSVLLRQDGEIHGILTESDVLRLAQRHVARDRPLGEVAHRPVRAVGPELDMRGLIAFMREGRLRHAVTMLDDGALHVISSRDVLNNLTGHYGAFLELRLRDLRATLDDLDAPVLEIARLSNAEVVSWSNRAATEVLGAQVDTPASRIFGERAWARARAELTESGHAVLPALVRGRRTWKVVLSQQALGEVHLVKAVLTDVTDLARMARRMRAHAAEAVAEKDETRRLFALMFDHAPNGMALLAQDGRILLANEETGRLHRRPAQDLVGLRLPELVHDDDWAAVSTQWDALWADDHTRSVEVQVRIVTADGSLQWVHAQASRVQGGGSPDDFAICTLTDTNAVHAAQARLEEARAEADRLARSLQASEARARAMLEQAAVGIATLDAKGRVLDPNPRVQEMFGRGRDSFIGLTAYDVMHPEDVDTARAQHAALRAGDRATVSTSRRYLRPDGSVFWGETAITPVRDADGTVQGLVAVIQDVTARRQATARTRELANLLDQGIAEIYILDPETGLITYANQAAQDALGHELAVLRRMRPHDIVTYPRAQLDKRLQQVLTSPEGSSITLQTEHRRADGSTYPVQSHISRITYNGRPHIAGVIIDATEEVRARRALLQQNLHFETAQRVAGVGSWELEADTGGMRWSAEMYRILGQEANTFVPTRTGLEDRFTPASAARLTAALDRVLRTGEPEDLRLDAVVGDRPRDVRIHIEARPGAVGPTGLLGTCLDITRLASVERELRDKTHWLEEGQRIARVGSWQWEAHTDRALLSRETYRILGMDPDAGIPSMEDFFASLEPGVRAEMEVYMMDLLSRRGTTIDYRHTVRAGGETRHVHQIADIVRDEAGEVVRIVGTINDVTAEVEASQLLERERLHLENAQGLGGVGSWEWNPSNGEVFWSPQTYTIFGLDPDGPTISMEEHGARLHPDDRGAFEQALGRCLQLGETVCLTYRFEVHGEERTFETTGERVRGHDGTLHVIGTTRDVTEQMRLQAELQAKTRWLEEAQRVARVGSWKWTAATDSLDWTPETYRIYGLDPETHTPTYASFFALLDPDTQREVAQNIAGMGEDNDRIDFTHRMKVRGEWRVLQQVGQIIRGPDGEVLQHIGTVNDITDEVRAAEELERQRTHLENAQWVGGIGSWEWDPTGERTFWSPQTYAIFGVDPDEPPTPTEAHLARVHPDDTETFTSTIERCMREGGPVRMEYRFEVGGEERILESVGLRVTSAEGRYHMVGTVRDVTATRAAEVARRDEQQQLEQAQRLAHVGSWEWNIRTGAFAWSTETFRIFGRDPADGPPDLDGFTERIHPDDRATVGRAIAAALEGPDRYDVEHRIQIDDEVRFIHEHGEVVRDSAGEPRRMLGTAHDITDHKRAQTRLNQSLKTTIQTLSRAFAKRDPYTATHQQRVADLCTAVGRRMGITARELEGLRLGAQVHDIGKISVPAEILALPRRLHPLEYKLIQTHSEHGWEILRGVDLPWPLADMIHMHHERIDGTGYPRGLSGDAIPPLVRILSVADVVEAMASHRPYRAGKGTEAALLEIEQGSGTRYDPDVVRHILGLFRDDGYALPIQ